MVLEHIRRMTVPEFDDWVEHADSEKRYEYIAGEIVEVTSNTIASKLAGLFFGELYLYLKNNDIGHLTGADGGYMVASERYIPDVAFLSYVKQKDIKRTGYNPNPPDLVVEVISNPANAQEQEDLRIKVTNYLAAGVVVWVVNYVKRTVAVHAPGKNTLLLRETQTLKGGETLPGFTLSLTDIFSKIPTE